MEQTLITKYVNPGLKIALVNWREAWDISNLYPEQLITETYRGCLVFRKKGSSQRVSYTQLKKGLIKKEMKLKLQLPPF